MTYEPGPAMGPTLYDFAGVGQHASSEELLDSVVVVGTLPPGATRVRAAFALEALLDPDFRAAYDDHLRNGRTWREQHHLPLLPEMPAAEWGSDEMGEWVRRASEVLVPSRPAPGRIVSVVSRLRLISNSRVHRLLVPAILLAGATPLLVTGSLPLQNVMLRILGDGPLASAVTISVAFLLGGALTALIDSMHSWRFRGGALIVAALTPALSAFPIAWVGLAVLLATYTLLGGFADRSYRTWAATEPLPTAPHSPWEPVDGRSSTRLGSSTADPVQAAAVLRAWASRLGHPVAAAQPVDLVAATVAADGWAFALGADSLTQAASFGPASLGAISAAVARAAGYPEPTMPLLPGPDASERRLPGLRTAVRDWKAWAELQLGRRNAESAIAAAAGDLVWGGGDEDRLSRLSRSLIR
jgi:hypothetical protein